MVSKKAILDFLKTYLLKEEVLLKLYTYNLGYVHPKRLKQRARVSLINELIVIFDKNIN